VVIAVKITPSAPVLLLVLIATPPISCVLTDFLVTLPVKYLLIVTKKAVAPFAAYKNAQAVEVVETIAVLLQIATQDSALSVIITRVSQAAINPVQLAVIVHPNWVVQNASIPSVKLVVVVPNVLLTMTVWVKATVPIVPTSSVVRLAEPIALMTANAMVSTLGVVSVLMDFAALQISVAFLAPVIMRVLVTVLVAQIMYVPWASLAVQPVLSTLTVIRPLLANTV